MNDVVSGVTSTIWGAGWIDSLAALIASVKEVVEAFRTIFYLIGKLFGG
jgi:hypothetical protein